MAGGSGPPRPRRDRPSPSHRPSLPYASPHRGEGDARARGRAQGPASHHAARPYHAPDRGPGPHRVPRHPDAVSRARPLSRPVRGRGRGRHRGPLAGRAVRHLRRAGRRRAAGAARQRRAAGPGRARAGGPRGRRARGGGPRRGRRAVRGRLPRSALRGPARGGRARRGGGGRRPAAGRGGRAPASDEGAAASVAGRARALEGAPVRGHDLDFPDPEGRRSAFSDVSRSPSGGKSVGKRAVYPGMFDPMHNGHLDSSSAACASSTS